MPGHYGKKMKKPMDKKKKMDKKKIQDENKQHSLPQNVCPDGW